MGAVRTAERDLGDVGEDGLVEGGDVGLRAEGDDAEGRVDLHKAHLAGGRRPASQGGGRRGVQEKCWRMHWNRRRQLRSEDPPGIWGPKCTFIHPCLIQRILRFAVIFLILIQSCCGCYFVLVKLAGPLGRPARAHGHPHGDARERAPAATGVSGRMRMEIPYNHDDAKNHRMYHTGRFHFCTIEPWIP